MSGNTDKPVVLITGAGGNLGQSLAESLADRFRVVGLDRRIRPGAAFPFFEADFSSAPSIELALERVARAYGRKLASVLHLVAYHEFSDEENPLYQSVNVEGTRALLRALQAFEVEQFVYASTMLVHRPCRPGERIDETAPIEPRWAYPRSKAAAEAVVHECRGNIPTVVLRLAGVYDERQMVPTLARQVARIYERDPQSYFYSGSTLVGQAMLHRDDMLSAFRLTIEARARLPAETTLLIGEADAIGYDALQDELGYLLHGAEDWPTLRVPKFAAAAGSWAHAAVEPVIPDAIDGGEKPFIKPFMVALADDHYALDIRRARSLIGWEPHHRLKDVLPRIVDTLKSDPRAWYEAHGIAAPAWVTDPVPIGMSADEQRRAHETRRREEHGENRWAHFANMGLGTWLVTQPPMIDLREPMLRAAEIGLGALLIVFAAAALSWRATWARWVCAAIGALVMAAPFVFWTRSPAAYTSDTLVGTLIFAFAVCLKPEPGTSAAAAAGGPSIPPGWTYNPSSWAQRLPIILMAVGGLYIGRYLAAYQLGHIPTAWEPFFPGSPDDPRNGTEEIITSWVAKAWPYPDAAIGAYTYLLEILTGIIGSRQRWRTMPWLVILFGLMIAPLAVTSIIFIIIQPVLLGTWSTLALIGAAAMLLQIPYSLDEIIATLQFLRRRARAGRNWVRILFVGDTDETEGREAPASADEFDRSLRAVMRDLVSGGVNLPWNLALVAAIGLALMFTRLTIGAAGDLANAHHVIGALALTVVSIAAAEVARPVRFVNVVLGAVLVAAPFLYGASPTHTVLTVAAGALIAVLSLRRGRVEESYAGWSRLLV